MAGRGSRFADAGYSMPKPLVPLHGVPMIEAVIHNLRPREPHRFIFLALEEHLEHSELAATLRRIAGDGIVVPVHGVTEGAACTALLARSWIDSDDPLIVANCDQWVAEGNDLFAKALLHGSAEALIMTMTAHDPRWSFVEIGESGRVVRVVEKEVISDTATVGIYGFRRGRDFVAAADLMISHNRKVKGEFYLAPVFNEMIDLGASVEIHSVGALDEGMFGLGTPEDVEAFLRRPQSQAVAGLRRAP
jgi:NDP-sugar pyrophosphorylase family protein